MLYVEVVVPLCAAVPLFLRYTPSPVYLQYKYCGGALVVAVKLISTVGSPGVRITTEYRER